MRDLNDIKTLRSALNAYNSCARAADGFVSGNRIANLRDAEKRLRALLWRHKDALIAASAVSESRPTPRMLRLPSVIELTGLGHDTIYKLARRGDFPAARRITERCSAWREDEVREWIESRPVSDLISPNTKSAASIGRPNNKPTASKR